MNTSRIADLRQEKGWTQEHLANESRVGLRTIQRLESGADASLETLSLVADALRVPVRDLFETIDDAALSSRVDSLQSRAHGQQVARDRISAAWWWLYIGVGVVVTLLCFTVTQANVLFLAYWGGGLLILIALRRLVLEPHLDDKYPLAHRKTRRSEKALARGSTFE